MAAADMVKPISSNVRNIRPPIVTFQPSMWGGIFSTFSFDHQVQEKYSKEIEALKKETRRMLMAAKSTELMIFIDKLERLGLAYHFEIEIEEKLKQVYDSAKQEEEDYDLFNTALRFRLLRQHQYHVSCVMDDTYDNYATLEENDIFTQILDRWNLDDIDVLPDFMQVVYRFIMSVYEEYVREAEKQGKSFAVPYYIETVKQLGRAYNQEQKWIMEGQMPSYEEYMRNSVITSCMFVMFTSSVPGMKSLNEETVQWLLSEPKIVISTTKLGRTLEDMGSHERENREGKLATVVDCYMKDKGVSKEEVICEFVELAENGWKDITAEWAKGSSVPKELMEQLLNYAEWLRSLTIRNKMDIPTQRSNWGHSSKLFMWILFLYTSFDYAF